MNDTYQISARVLPFAIQNIPGDTDDARLKEVRLRIPMRGDQTIAELFTKIEKIYFDIYPSAGRLRIRNLESVEGDVLHTSLKVADCFETRNGTDRSSQWTVVVRRQTPTAEEIEEYRRNTREFSILESSYAQPQGRPVGAFARPIELSANSHTPSRHQVPVETNGLDTVIPSTEREIQLPSYDSEPRQRLSQVDVIVPSTQQFSVQDSLATATAPLQADPVLSSDSVKSESPEVSYLYTIPQESRREPVKAISHEHQTDVQATTSSKKPRARTATVDHDTEDGPVAKKRKEISSTITRNDRSTPSTASIIEPGPTTPKQIAKSARADPFDVQSQPMQTPLGSKRHKQTPVIDEERLPEHNESPSASKSTPLDDRAGVRGTNATRKTPSTDAAHLDKANKQTANGIVQARQAIQVNGQPVAASEDEITSEGSSSTENDNEKVQPAINSIVPRTGSRPRSDSTARSERSDKLRENLAQERAEIAKLSSPAVASTPRKKTKLTAPIPGSHSKKSLTPVPSAGTQDANETGLQLLHTHNATPPTKTKTRTGQFTPTRFREIDKAALERVADKAKIQELTGDAPATSSEEDDENDVAVRSVSPVPPTSNQKAKHLSTKSPSRRVSFQDEAHNKDEASSASPDDPNKKLPPPKPVKGKRGRPTKEEQARRETELGGRNDEPPTTSKSPPGNKRKPKPKKKSTKARERASTTNEDEQSVASTVQHDTVDEQVAEQSGDIKKRGRGRPPGSTKKAKSINGDDDATLAKAGKGTKTGTNSGDNDSVPAKAEKKKKSTSKATSKDNNSPEDDNETSVTKRRGRPPGSKNKSQLGDDKTASEQTKSPTSDSTKKSKSNPKIGTETSINDAGSTSKTSRKRKATSEERNAESSIPAKKARKSSKDVNASAMDESEDRAAVISATKQKTPVPPTKASTALARQTSAGRSYSRSPAKEVVSSDDDTSSSESESDEDSDTDLPPLRKLPPVSSQDQAAAQLQSENVASSSAPRKPNFTAVNGVKSGLLNKTNGPRKSKLLSLKEEVGRQPAAPRSSQSHIRGNPQYMSMITHTPSQPPRTMPMPGDSDTSSSESEDSEDDDTQPSLPAKSSQKGGFKKLLQNLGPRA